jgi:hypothetical protein
MLFIQLVNKLPSPIQPEGSSPHSQETANEYRVNQLDSVHCTSHFQMFISSLVEYYSVTISTLPHTPVSSATD